MRFYLMALTGLLGWSLSGTAAGPAVYIKFTGVFWTKQNCKRFEEQCLPKRTATVRDYAMKKALPGQRQRLHIRGDHFDVVLFMRHDERKSYIVFQTELTDKSGKSIAVCSRYESVATFENVPVGACAGRFGDDQMAGFSIIQTVP